MLLLSMGLTWGTFCSKDWDIDEWDENDGSGDLGGIEGGDELFNGDDGGVFGAVGAEMSAEDFAGLGAVYDNDGDVCRCVDACGDIEIAGGFLAGAAVAVQQ